MLVLDRGRGVFTLPRVQFARRPGGGRGAARERDRDRERSLLLALLHLGALWALAVAQPLFDLIGQNPDFLAARGMRGLEVVRFAVLIALAPPLILVALEAGSGLVVAGLRRWLHSALVAVLFGLIGDPGAQADT